MDKQDKYIVKRTRGGTGVLFFYKNDLLHREAGPAIVTPSNMDIYLQLGDEHLYEMESINTDFPDGYNYEYIKEEEIINGRLAQVAAIPIFYVEGEPYTHKEFQEIKSRLDLKNELNSELSTIQTNNKKAKI